MLCTKEKTLLVTENAWVIVSTTAGFYQEKRKNTKKMKSLSRKKRKNTGVTSGNSILSLGLAWISLLWPFSNSSDPPRIIKTPER